MGNCQAAEVATVVVQHPENGKVDKMHWSVRANEVMGLNPGYYVALVVEPPSRPGQPGKNHLKLLRPDDTLHIGHVYRLISFEEVINGFAEKKSVKLGNLLKESGATLGDDKNNNLGACRSNFDNTLVYTFRDIVFSVQEQGYHAQIPLCLLCRRGRVRNTESMSLIISLKSTFLSMLELVYVSRSLRNSVIVLLRMRLIRDYDGSLSNLTENDNQQGGGGYRSIGRRHCGGGQWRPALQSIAEF